MDREDLQTILRFARQNKVMHLPFSVVLKWYNVTNSLKFNQYNNNLVMP